MTSSLAWENTIDTIEQNDPYIRGIVILGLGESEERLASCFRAVASTPLVKGFAVGRTIFADVAKIWMKGEISDAQAVEMMADNYQKLCQIWDEARGC